MSGRVEEALSEGPSELAFRACCAALERLTPDESVARARALEVLATWPERVRVGPWTWAAALAAREPEGVLAQATELRLCDGSAAAVEVRADQLDAARLGELRALTSGYLGLDKAEQTAAWLEASASRLRNLRDLDLPGLLDDRKRPLCEMALFAGLSGVTFDDIEALAGDHPGVRAPELQRLRTEVGDPALALETLRRNDLSSLRVLELTNCAPRPPSAPLEVGALVRPLEELTTRSLAASAVTALLLGCTSRLRRLHVVFPDEASLELVGPTEGAFDERQASSIAGSRALEGIERLTLTNGLSGDLTIAMIEATTPGVLRELTLSSVGMRGEALQKLAELPHARQLESLTLLDEEPDMPSVSRLVEALSGGKLRALRVGSWGGTPYYTETAPRDGGDLVATALSRAELPWLRRVELTRLALTPQGCIALSSCRSPIEQLGISHSPLRLDGIRSLLSAPRCRGLRSLTLDECHLDDECMGEIAGAQWDKLRELSLAYNSVGAAGASALASAESLSTLYRLSLHDNWLDDDGLVALARSCHLTSLIELDIEQDCWNSRTRVFGARSAAAVADSPTLASLDTLRAGVVDEYHCGKSAFGFEREGMERIAASTTLRPPARWGIAWGDAKLESQRPRAARDEEMLYLDFRLRHLRAQR